MADSHRAQLLALSLKRCSYCSELKHLDDFRRSPHGGGGKTTVCVECSKAASIRWARANRERKAQTDRLWRERNPDRYRAGMRAQSRKRRLSPEYRISCRVGSSLRQSLKSHRGAKGGRTFEIIGYSPQELIAHLERQFLKGMSWDNMGEWHIDHIIPLSSFKITGPDDPELKRAWALANLRPLWAQDNLRKSSKVTHLL